MKQKQTNLTTPVKSTAIKAIGYEPATQTLRLEFNSGHVGEYANVPPEKHAAMMAASSIGQYFHAHIRSKHEHTRING